MPPIGWSLWPLGRTVGKSLPRGEPVEKNNIPNHQHLLPHQPRRQRLPEGFLSLGCPWSHVLMEKIEGGEARGTEKRERPLCMH